MLSPNISDRQGIVGIEIVDGDSDRDRHKTESSADLVSSRKSN
jgi:hypothetical protein